MPTTKPVQQQPSGGGSQQQTAQGSNQQGDATEPTGQPFGSVWDQSFYDTLNPEQKALYESFDDETRSWFKQEIESGRELKQQGYKGDGNLTQEQVSES
ncbi:hypothetical protein [uncultured Oscillibacter sp.]|uniref:hypothetical protein n=1 Tax=uncultured Oscillibacter sp. TaxID=876091 RepID=UPI00266F0CF5|nr:hypothetical protein [uncultured Oscillibacter sp.]